MLGKIMAAGAFVMGMAGAAHAQQTPPQTVGDWQIECTQTEVGPQCILSQTLSQTSTNQRVVTLALQETGDGRMAGNLLMPFGLFLAAGVQLTIGDRALDARLPFSTCLPVGCIVPIGFEASIIADFAAGSTLSLTVIIADSGEPATFTLEMSGLEAARTQARAQN